MINSDVINSEDGESQEAIKNARKQSEVPMEAAIFCKIGTKEHFGFQEGEEKSDEINKIPKTKQACFVEVHESTKKRSEPTLPKYHEDHIAEKGCNSKSHYNLVHKLLLTPQAMEVPDGKAAVDKEWKKLKTIPAGHCDGHLTNQKMRS